MHRAGGWPRIGVDAMASRLSLQKSIALLVMLIVLSSTSLVMAVGYSPAIVNKALAGGYSAWTSDGANGWEGWCYYGIREPNGTTWTVHRLGYNSGQVTYDNEYPLPAGVLAGIRAAGLDADNDGRPDCFQPAPSNFNDRLGNVWVFKPGDAGMTDKAGNNWHFYKGIDGQYWVSKTTSAGVVTAEHAKEKAGWQMLADWSLAAGTDLSNLAFGSDADRTKCLADMNAQIAAGRGADCAAAGLAGYGPGADAATSDSNKNGVPDYQEVSNGWADTGISPDPDAGGTSTTRPSEQSEVTKGEIPKAGPPPSSGNEELDASRARFAAAINKLGLDWMALRGAGTEDRDLSFDIPMPGGSNYRVNLSTSLTGAGAWSQHIATIRNTLRMFVAAMLTIFFFGKVWQTFRQL